MFVVGLTGGIGSGKTAASNRFSALGITVVDADVVSRLVVEPGRPALAEIRDYFGPDVINADGTLNRARLRQIVFASPDARKQLEAITHPRIREEIHAQIAASRSPYTVLVSPLLFESGQYELTQRKLVIDTPEELQVQRATSRDGVDASQIQAIIKAQMTREARLLHADDVVINAGSLDNLHQQIDQLHRGYLALVVSPTQSTPCPPRQLPHP